MQIFDSHFHIIDHQYPLQMNNGFLPDNYLVKDYQHTMQHEQLIGGVVVSGSFHGLDQTYIQPTLKNLGASYSAVTQLASDIDEDTILKLDAIGVKGIRFNLVRGNKFTAKKIRQLALTVNAVAGWHSEFYINPKLLEDVFDTITSLAATSIDHLGLCQTEFNKILSLAEHGTKIKASGFGRLDFDVGPLLKRIHKTNPDALMFGSDLPSTRAMRKYTPGDIELIKNNFSPENAQRILYKNALKFYRMNLPE